VELVESFLQQTEIEQTKEPQLDTAEKQWVYLEGSNKWEHAEWIDTVKLEKMLEDALSRSDK
jgi:hypothetical protein